MIEHMFDTMVSMAPTELVLAIADSQRQEAILVAKRMSAVAELLAQRTNVVEGEDPDPGYMMVTGFQRTVAEVAAACNLSPAAAGVVVAHADALANRLPQVAAVLAAGDTDWRTVQVIIARSELVSEKAISRVDAQSGVSDLVVALLVAATDHQRRRRDRARSWIPTRSVSGCARKTSAASM